MTKPPILKVSCYTLRVFRCKLDIKCGRTTSWVFTLGGGAVSWGSKKQTCISHSTMEIEFIFLIAIGKESKVS